MRINSISNNVSFGALLIDKKKASDKQKQIMQHVINTVAEDKAAINILKSKHSDIFVSPNDDKESVDLKILTAAGLCYNFLPCDNNGEVQTNLHLPPQSFDINNAARMEDNIKLRTRRFIKRALQYAVYDTKTQINDEKRMDLENLSYSDMAENEVSRPDILPDAKVLFGNSAIETKSFLKHQ